MNIQGWFPLGLTGLISLQSKGLSRALFSTTVCKHQFFSAQFSLWLNSHICTWLVLTIGTFVGKVISLLFNTLSRFVKWMPKNAQTITQLHSFHTLVKQCSKFSMPGFSNMWTVNFQMFKLILEKAPEVQLHTSDRSSKKQESSRKTSTSALLTTPESLTVWFRTNCGKFFKRWEYQTH